MVAGAMQRMISGPDAVDIRDATGFAPGIRAGTADHIALRLIETGPAGLTNRSFKPTLFLGA